MKKLILSFLVLMIFSAASSQKIYFIYLQSESGQLFYLKMNEKLHSSTASGYLILSRLKDSSYSFSVSFPQNKWPEQKFTVEVKGKDHGYLLKDFGEKGWGLFDMQTMTIQMALPGKSTGAIKTEPKQVSEFTAILSKAADDPSLKEQPVALAVKMEEKSVAIQPAILKEEIKPVMDPPVVKQSLPPDVNKEESGIAKENTSTVKESQPPVVKNDAPAVIKKDESTIAKENSSSVKESQLPVAKNDLPSVTKKEETAQVKENSTSKKDAQLPGVKQDPPPVVKEAEIRSREQPVASIEDPSSVPVAEYKRSIVTKKAESSTSEGFGLTFLDEYADGKKDTIRIIIPNSKKILAEIAETTQDERKFLDLPASDSVKQKEPSTKTNTKEKEAGNLSAKPACNAASENDFLKLRKRMAAEKRDGGMIYEARRIFKSKCFTVNQLKNLSVLFLNDDGRYNFFDAAYSHVVDKDNFASLSAELTDAYYVNRFKAMLR